MGIYDDISNILRTNPFTSISYAAGANVGKVVQNTPKINLPSAVSSLRPVVSVMALPLSPAISGAKLVQSIPKINLPSTTMSLKPLVSVAPMLAIPTPVISSARVVQNIPNVASSLSHGYENVNAALSGVTKQVFPSYQETGYMFNKLVADPLYGQSVKQRTGLLPSENWIATTSPGAMATGGYTVVQKNADGTETRTKYGFKTNGSIASNVMQGITGFAEGGWNMPRERPLDTALILATGGVGEIAAGTSLGAKVLASPAARYGLIAGVGLYGGDVASRVAGVGDATADKSIYGMAKRLGGITTTEIAPGSVAISPLVKGVKSGIKSERIVKSIERTRGVASHVGVKDQLLLPSGDAIISRSEREVIFPNIGKKEWGTGFSVEKGKVVDYGSVKGNEFWSYPPTPYTEDILVPVDSVGSLTDFGDTIVVAKKPLSNPDYFVGGHSHPQHVITLKNTGTQEKPFIDNQVVKVSSKYTSATAHPSGGVGDVHDALLDAYMSSRVYSRIGDTVNIIDITPPRKEDTWIFRTDYELNHPLAKFSKMIGNAIGNTLAPFSNQERADISARIYVDELKLPMVENIKYNVLKKVEGIVSPIAQDTLTKINEKGLIFERKKADALELVGDIQRYTYDLEYGKLAPNSIEEVLHAIKNADVRTIDEVRKLIRPYGADVIVRQYNMKTGEQKIVDYPTSYIRSFVYDTSGKPLALPAPTPITPAVYNQPATSVSEVKQLIESKMPTLKDGYTRLYRVDPVSQSATGSSKPPSWLSEHSDTYAGRWFSDDLGNALWYWNQRASGDLDIPKLSYVDVPTKDVSAYKVSNIPKSKVEDASMFMDNPAAFSLNPTQEFYIPKLLAQQKEPVLTATKRLDNIGLIFPEGNYPGPRKQRYNQKKKLVKTGKKSKTTKKRLIPQKKKPHLIVPKKKQQRSKQRTSLSTGTKIEKQMSKNVNRFLGW